MGYSYQQLEQLWTSAGGNPQAAPTAAAIALAESGGEPGAQGDLALQNGQWGPSVGLWQIRSLNSETGTGGTRDASILGNPVANARSAVAISNDGSNFTPWTTYTSGAYKHYLGAQASTIAYPSSSGAGTTLVSTGAQPLGSINLKILGTHDPLPGALTVALFGIASVLIVVGLLRIFGVSAVSAGKKGAKVAGTVGTMALAA